MPDATNHFLLMCHDAEDGKSKRAAHLQAHLRFVEQQLDEQTIAVAGPLSVDDEFVGSLFIVRATTADQARQWLNDDPYFKAGVWQHIEVTAFRPVAGNWVGGRAW